MAAGNFIRDLAWSLYRERIAGKGSEENMDAEDESPVYHWEKEYQPKFRAASLGDQIVASSVFQKANHHLYILSLVELATEDGVADIRDSFFKSFSSSDLTQKMRMIKCIADLARFTLEPSMLEKNWITAWSGRRDELKKKQSDHLTSEALQTIVRELIRDSSQHPFIRYVAEQCERDILDHSVFINGDGDDIDKRENEGREGADFLDKDVQMRFQEPHWYWPRQPVRIAKDAIGFRDRDGSVFLIDKTDINQYPPVPEDEAFRADRGRWYAQQCEANPSQENLQKILQKMLSDQTPHIREVGQTILKEGGTDLESIRIIHLLKEANENIQDRRQIVRVRRYAEAEFFDAFQKAERNPRGELDVGELLKELHRTTIRDRFQEDFGFDIRELTLREQVWFMETLGRMDSMTIERIRGATKTFGLDFARAFLPAAGDSAFHKVLLDIVTRLPEEQSKAVFARYAELTELTQRTLGEIVPDVFKVGHAVDIPAVQREILSRGKALLQRAANTPDAAEIIRQLELIKPETVLFASAVKSYFKGNPDASFEAVRGLSLETITGAELSATDQVSILAMADENWKEVPTMHDFIVSHLSETLKTAAVDTKWYLVRKDGKVTASIRFDRKKDGSAYAGSANVSPELRGSGIGETILREAFDAEAAKGPIHGNVYPDSPVGTAYVEQNGFVIDGVEEIDLGAGRREWDFTITRDDALAGRYRAAGIAPARLMMAFMRPESLETGELAVRAFRLPKEKEAMRLAVGQAARDGKVASRYFSDPSDQQVRYLAFEKKPEPAVRQKRPAA